ncbi:MAG: hypothetical protein EOP46_10520 [Sphingobacteriaceae bacterium]|nr:MAG: hypothetical protein EOP46_10520 [Sphingobacteriaceae bacterium]
MKQGLFTILLAGAAILSSCKKDKQYPNIKEYDQQQIQSYIQSNGLSGMKRDTADGDTAGIYYQVLEQGTGDRIEYSDRVAMVYTIRTFDGKFVSADTLLNHFYGYLGQFSTSGLPRGLQSGIYNALKNKGGSVRFLIPSRLAYGINGTGSGSVENPNRINGNQCLDYWVRIVDDQREYDSIAIQKYTAKYSINLSEYTRASSGLYYKITGSDTGTLIKDPSRIAYTYAVRNLNNVLLTEQTTDITSEFENLPLAAIKEAALLTRNAQSVSLLIPSRLGYGNSAVTSGNVTVIPAFSCLKYDYTIKSVYNY